MPYHIYITSVIGLYVLQIIGAIYILDIGLIFEFVSAISVSALAFIFPGGFYLISLKKYGALLDEKQKSSRDKKSAWFFVIFGIIMLVF